MKRFAALILCVLSVVMLFAACGEEAKDPTVSDSSFVSVPRIKELDGTVWPLSSQTYSDGTGMTAEDLNNYGFYGCLSFAGGKYTLVLDTSPVTGDYNVNGSEVELVGAYTMKMDGDTLVLDMSGAALNFTKNSALVPVGELDINGTVWDLTYMKNDVGVYNQEALAAQKTSGTLSFSGNTFTMVNDYAGSVNSQSGTFETSQALVSLTVGDGSIYGVINGENLIIAESGISMVYTLRK